MRVQLIFLLRIIWINCRAHSMNHPIKCVSMRAPHSRASRPDLHFFCPHCLTPQTRSQKCWICDFPQVFLTCAPRLIVCHSLLEPQNLGISASASASPADSDSSRLGWKSKFRNRICMPIKPRLANKTNQTK